MQTTKKPLRKINTDGFLVEYNNSLKRWEILSKIWSWSDISKGYKRESKANFKKAFSIEFKRAVIHNKSK